MRALEKQINDLIILLHKCSKYSIILYNLSESNHFSRLITLRRRRTSHIHTRRVKYTFGGGGGGFYDNDGKNTHTHIHNIK